MKDAIKARLLAENPAYAPYLDELFSAWYVEPKGGLVTSQQDYHDIAREYIESKPENFPGYDSERIEQLASVVASTLWKAEKNHIRSNKRNKLGKPDPYTREIVMGFMPAQTRLYRGITDPEISELRSIAWGEISKDMSQQDVIQQIWVDQLEREILNVYPSYPQEEAYRLARNFVSPGGGLHRSKTRSLDSLISKDGHRAVREWGDAPPRSLRDLLQALGIEQDPKQSPIEKVLLDREFRIIVVSDGFKYPLYTWKKPSGREELVWTNGFGWRSLSERAPSGLSETEAELVYKDPEFLRLAEGFFSEKVERLVESPSRTALKRGTPDSLPDLSEILPSDVWDKRPSWYARKRTKNPQLKKDKSGYRRRVTYFRYDFFQKIHGSPLLDRWSKGAIEKALYRYISERVHPEGFPAYPNRGKTYSRDEAFDFITAGMFTLEPIQELRRIANEADRRLGPDTKTLISGRINAHTTTYGLKSGGVTGTDPMPLSADLEEAISHYATNIVEGRYLGLNFGQRNYDSADLKPPTMDLLQEAMALAIVDMAKHLFENIRLYDEPRAFQIVHEANQQRKQHPPEWDTVAQKLDDAYSELRKQGKTPEEAVTFLSVFSSGTGGHTSNFLVIPGSSWKDRQKRIELAKRLEQGETFASMWASKQKRVQSAEEDAAKKESITRTYAKQIAPILASLLEKEKINKSHIEKVLPEGFSLEDNSYLGQVAIQFPSDSGFRAWMRTTVGKDSAYRVIIHEIMELAE